MIGKRYVVVQSIDLGPFYERASFVTIHDAYEFVEKIMELPRISEVGGNLESMRNIGNMFLAAKIEEVEI